MKHGGNRWYVCGVGGLAVEDRFKLALMGGRRA